MDSDWSVDDDGLMRIAAAFWALAVAAATTVTLCDQMGLPSSTFWAERHRLVYASIGILALLALEETVRRIRQVRHAEHAYERERNMRAAMAAAMRLTVEQLSVPWDELGVHAFYLRRGPFVRLRHVGGLRLGLKPSMVDPWWRPGKGVVGAAATAKDTVCENWEEFYRQGLAAGPEGWSKRPIRQRYGLSWGELKLTADYKGIVAAPIFRATRSGRLVGTVVIDGPLSRDQMKNRDMDEILRTLAIGVETAR